MNSDQITKLNIQETVDSSVYLGLENYLASFRSGAPRGRAIREAILQEQQRQISLGLQDPEVLSLLSETLSERSREKAHVIGLFHRDE